MADQMKEKEDIKKESSSDITSLSPSSEGVSAPPLLGPQIPKEEVESLLLQKNPEIPLIHSRIETEFESDQGYQAIADNIISISKEYLFEQQTNKVRLRRRFSIVFSTLLVLQYIFLVMFLLLDGVTALHFDISEEIMKLYITSVFVQTLSAMGVMIAFAFASSDETKIVDVLNSVISSYQKVRLDTPQERIDSPEESKITMPQVQSETMTTMKGAGSQI